MKTAVVLGAGVYQLPLIAKLQARGYHVVTVSRDGPYPGFGTADEVFICDIVDRDRILEFCRSRDLALITTAGSDVGLPSIGLVNDALGLPGISFQAAQWSSSKKEMKERFAACGVRAAKRRPLEAYMGQDGFKPFVAKLDVSSGSAGVFLVRKPEDYHRYALDKQPDLMFEDLVEGEEFGAQVVITDRVERIFVHGDDTFQGSAPVPVGHTTYFDDLPLNVDDLVEQVTRSQEALGLRDCVANYDFILSEDGCYVLEVGARVGATGLSEMIWHANGVDLFEITIDLALGDRSAVQHGLGDGPLLAQSDQVIESYLLFSARDNCTLTAGIRSYLDAQGSVLEYELDYADGTVVNRLQKGSDRFGLMVVAAESKAEPYNASRKVLAGVRDLM